jgi:hypothetical protein
MFLIWMMRRDRRVAGMEFENVAIPDIGGVSDSPWLE